MPRTPPDRPDKRYLNLCNLFLRLSFNKLMQPDMYVYYYVDLQSKRGNIFLRRGDESYSLTVG